MSTLNPSKIIQVGMGFWASKTLLAANKLELFTFLGDQALTSEEIKRKLDLNSNRILDFLDALHSLGFLEREGVGAEARYSNTPETALFLNAKSGAYIGGFLEMANDREYDYWSGLEDALKTGQAQNEIKETGKESFEAIYSSEEGLRVFTDGMTGIQLGSFLAFSELFDFTPYKSLLDLGGSAGVLSAVVAKQHPHMTCTTYDMAQLTPFVKETCEKYGVDNVNILEGNFFEDDYPKVDVITMGNILHSFDMEKKYQLLRKSYESLNENGALCVIEMILDDERKHNTFGLLMSLNMAIESDNGFNFTQSQLRKWAEETGFSKVEFTPIPESPVSIATLYK